jgi:parallel beta-helix repeat protein
MIGYRRLTAFSATIRCCATFFCVIIAGVSSFGAEGRTPIWTSPTVISAAGRYVVTRNIAGPGGGPVIEILASNVDLDLNGMEVRQPDQTASAISVTGATEVRVHDGSIVGGLVGINAGPGRRIVIEHVSITDVDFRGIGLSGVESFAVRGCTVQDVADTPNGSGIVVSGGGHGVIENNAFQRSHRGIVAVSASAVIIRHNRFGDILGAGPASNGVMLQTCSSIQVAENTFQSALDSSIKLSASDGCSLVDNVIRAGAFGIFIDGSSNDNVVRQNLVSDCTSVGIEVYGDRNVIEGNTANANLGFGIRLQGGSADNIYRENAARGNAGAGPCTVVTTSDFCNSGTGNTSALNNFLPTASM